MSHSVDDSTLRVRPASSLFQTGVSAHPVAAAFLVRLAVVVPVARVSHALDVRLALEPVRARANGPVVDHATLGVLSAPRRAVVARIFAFLVETRTIAGAVRVRATPDHAHRVRTYVALRTCPS